MKLRLTTSEHEAIITREKWGVLAFALFGDAMCIAVGSVFCILALQKTWEPAIFPLLFGIAFVAIGFSHLALIFPKLAKNVLQDDGLRVLVANKDGLTLNNVIGCQPEYHRWEDISEIILTSELKTVDTFESSYTWNVILVMLTPESLADKSFMLRVKAGITTTQSSHGYTLVNYAPAFKDDLTNLLQRFIKRSNVVKYYKKSVFNTKGDAFISEVMT